MAEMTEARTSWNTRYLSTEGFDIQITLRDDDEAALLKRAKKVITGIVKAGGKPVTRSSNPRGRGSSKREPKYVERGGKLYCNQRLGDRSICGAEGAMREGRCGWFFACPNYKNHAR